MSAVCDPYFPYVSLLLHMDGPNGSNNFPDSSSFGNSVSVVSNFFTPVVSNSVFVAPPFGQASMNISEYPNGGSGDGITVPITAGGPLDLSDAAIPFTIEFWLYMPMNGNFAGNCVFAFYNNASLVYSTFGASTGSGPEFSWDYYDPNFGGFRGLNIGWSSFVSTWVALALTWDGTTLRSYANGTLISSATYAEATFGPGGAGTLYFGFGPISNHYTTNGNFKELRVTKGIARYTGSSYTVQTAEFPNLACNQGYGKFVLPVAYPPILVANAGQIEPRVWKPAENVTVRRS